MAPVNRHYRNGKKIEIKLPRCASAESLFLLVHVFEQLIDQIFSQFDDEIADEIMKCFNSTESSPEMDVDNPDLPF